MIQTIYTFLTKVGITSNQDKVLHFIAGFIITAIGTFLFNIATGLLFAGIAAVGKELYDKYIKKTEFDFFDMYVTLLGMFTFLIPYAVIEGLIEKGIL